MGGLERGFAGSLRTGWASPSQVSEGSRWRLPLRSAAIPLTADGRHGMEEREREEPLVPGSSWGETVQFRGRDVLDKVQDCVDGAAAVFRGVRVVDLSAACRDCAGVGLKKMVRGMGFGDCLCLLTDDRMRLWPTAGGCDGSMVDVTLSAKTSSSSSSSVSDK